MPDPVRVLIALGCAAALSAAVLYALRGPWTAPNRRRIAAGWVLALAAGIYAGCRILGLWPHWPPSEDQDRLLMIVLPAVVTAELLAAVPRVPTGLVLALRLLVAAGAARVLLHGTNYISHAAGPDSRLWSATQIWLALGGLTLGLASVWWALAALGRRPGGCSLIVSLALACGGAAMTVMLSGYMSGGQLGLPLAAALAGAALVSLVLPKPLDVTGAIGVSTVMLFSLLVIGRFFGELSTSQACVLFSAPLLGWLPELPRIRQLPPLVRGSARVLLVSVAVAGVVAAAQHKFVEQSQAPSNPGQTGIDDYMNFGS